MQRDRPRTGTPADWLRHARSDLGLARVPIPADVLLETLCFHAQQAAEKAIKAVLVQRGITLPKTHNLKILLELLPPDSAVPPHVAQSSRLTDYAVALRYPGEREDISEQEYRDALRLAESVVTWAEKVIEGK